MAYEPNTSLEYITRNIPPELQGYNKALFIGEIEKINTVGASKKLLVLTYDRIVCSKREAWAKPFSRYQKTEHISAVMWQHVQHKKMPGVRVLIKMPRERDLFVLFTWLPHASDSDQQATKFLTALDKIRNAHRRAGSQNPWFGLSEVPNVDLKSRANLKGPVSKPSDLLTEYNSPKRSPSRSPRSSQRYQAPALPPAQNPPPDPPTVVTEDADSGVNLFNELSAETVAKPKSLDIDINKINDIDVIKKRFSEQSEFCAKLEKHFVHIRAMNSYMSEQIRSKTEEVERLSSRQQDKASPMSPGGVSNSVRKVSFIGLAHGADNVDEISNLEQQLREAKSQIEEEKNLQEDVAMLSSTVDELHKKRIDDESKITELKNLINGLLQDKGEMVQENLKLQMSIEKQDRPATENASTDCSDIIIKETCSHPKVTEFTAKLLDIGMNPNEVQRLASISVRKREHLAFVTFSELKNEPCCLPVPVIRRMLLLFRFQQGKREDDNLIDVAKSGNGVSESLRDLQAITSSIIEGSYVHSETSLSSPGGSSHRVHQSESSPVETKPVPPCTEYTLPIPSMDVLEHRPSVDISFFSGLSSGSDTSRSLFDKTQAVKQTTAPGPGASAVSFPTSLVPSIGIDVTGARKAFSEESSSSSFGSSSTSTVSTD